jgi:hypothetical protein
LQAPNHVSEIDGTPRSVIRRPWDKGELGEAEELVDAQQRIGASNERRRPIEHAGLMVEAHVERACVEMFADGSPNGSVPKR